MILGGALCNGYHRRFQMVWHWIHSLIDWWMKCLVNVILPLSTVTLALFLIAFLVCGLWSSTFEALGKKKTRPTHPFKCFVTGMVLFLSIHEIFSMYEQIMAQWCLDFVCSWEFRLCKCVIFLSVMSVKCFRLQEK
jgi:hypothetical protein